MKILLPLAVFFATACNCQDGYFDLVDEEEIDDEKLNFHIEQLSKLEVELLDLKKGADEIVGNLTHDLEHYPVVKRWKIELTESGDEKCQEDFNTKLDSLKNEFELEVQEYAAQLGSIYQDLDEIRKVLVDDLLNEDSPDENDYATEPISETVKSAKSKVNLLIILKKLFPYRNREDFLLREHPQITNAINERVTVPLAECLGRKDSLTRGS